MWKGVSSLTATSRNEKINSEKKKTPKNPHQLKTSLLCCDLHRDSSTPHTAVLVTSFGLQPSQRAWQQPSTSCTLRCCRRQCRVPASGTPLHRTAMLEPHRVGSRWMHCTAQVVTSRLGSKHTALGREQHSAASNTNPHQSIPVL